MSSANVSKAQAALANLERFNRKERYHLLREAVVGGRFPLRENFRKKLLDKLPIDEIPNDAYVAMDYHLDWVASALWLAETDQEGDGSHSSPLKNWLPNPGGGEKNWRVMTGNQEDADLLVAWVSGEQLHLVFVEAKVESGWDGSQLKSKGERLGNIFADDSPWRRKGYVKPYFVLAGPMPKEAAPKFSPETLSCCPGWFFAPELTIEERQNAEIESLRKQLACVQLLPAHDLYQPRRTEKKESADWYVIRTQSVKE